METVLLIGMTGALGCLALGFGMFVLDSYASWRAAQYTQHGQNGPPKENIR